MTTNKFHNSVTLFMTLSVMIWIRLRMDSLLKLLCNTNTTPAVRVPHYTSVGLMWKNVVIKWKVWYKYCNGDGLILKNYWSSHINLRNNDPSTTPKWHSTNTTRHRIIVNQFHNTFSSKIQPLAINSTRNLSDCLTPSTTKYQF